MYNLKFTPEILEQIAKNTNLESVKVFNELDQDIGACSDFYVKDGKLIAKVKIKPVEKL